MQTIDQERLVIRNVFVSFGQGDRFVTKEHSSAALVENSTA